MLTELTGLAREMRTNGKVITNPNDILSNDEIDEISKIVKNAEIKGGIVPEVLSIDIYKISPLLKTKSGESFFWSGRTNGIGGQDVALQIAKERGGVTLEGLIELNNIKMPIYDPSIPSSIKAWEDVSAAYASQVSGEIRSVVGKDLRVGNVWENTELPLLKANSRVTKITTIDPATLSQTIIFKR
ncbi:hypothetical protein [Dyadobacter sp. 32]|uniref:hypothetical protein n=1 Tax=Dyadobacter sp. 32 TaxID=538966 RepID=UPI0011ED1741